MKAFLVLEDGSVFEGESFGYDGTTEGEVVFNTGMTGYQEILTDPSYAGQIVTMTYPLIGNYGINDDDFQSDAPKVKGFIVKRLEDKPSNFRSRVNLDEYLKAHKIVGICGIDTRSIVRKIRSFGTMKGLITTFDGSIDDVKINEIVNKLKHTPLEKDLLQRVSAKEPYHIKGNGKRLAVIDLGIKSNILKGFKMHNIDMYVFPYNAVSSDVMSVKPDGLFLSNGPGDPKDAIDAIKLVSDLKAKIPIMGICLGHQIISLALGADTYKLKFGHRGSNHPVKDLRTNRVYITSQNHGYAVNRESITSDMKVTHINLNDGTVEGIMHTKMPIYSVQYHPEASPGPKDSSYLFDDFVKLLL